MLTLHIDRAGKIYQLVEDLKIAWHAGKSKWDKFNNLNEFSIGIELQNKGHKLGYQNFSKKQIMSLINLGKKLKKKYKIKSKNFLGHSDIAPLRKIRPKFGEVNQKCLEFGIKKKISKSLQE